MHGNRYRNTAVLHVPHVENTDVCWRAIFMNYFPFSVAIVDIWVFIFGLIFIQLHKFSDKTTHT